MSDAAARTFPVVTPARLPEPSLVGRALARFGTAHDAPMPMPLAGGAVGVAVVVALLATGNRPGLGLAFTIPLIWAPAVPALLRRRAWGTLVTAALAVALGSVAAIRDAEWVVALSLLAAFGLTAVAAAGARSPLGLALAVPTAPAAVTRGLVWFAGGLVVASHGHRAEMGRWLRTAAITAVILAVFSTLLASADAVFATLLPSLDLSLLPARLAVGVLAGAATLGVASLAVRRPGWSVTRLARPGAYRPAEWFVPVLALGALMVAFLVTQVATAVGGDDYVDATAGLTYAAYARQGFGQLVAVTALTLVVVAWFARRAPRPAGGAAPGRAVRAALAVLCVAALGVVATALVRMSLYVQAYGLTELRLLAATGEAVMGAILLLVLAAGVRWRARWLPLAAVRVAGVAMLLLALANPSALMVRYNTGEQEVPLDIWHLQQLSADAVPAIDSLEEPLRSCLLAHYETAAPGSVWEWNLSRSHARAADDVLAGHDCLLTF